MNAPENDTSQATLDAKMLAELRIARDTYPPRECMFSITLEELDMLLRVADERDRLKAEHVDMPDDLPAPVRVRVDSLPPGHAVIGGIVTPLPVEIVTSPTPSESSRHHGDGHLIKRTALCKWCGGKIASAVGWSSWFHVQAPPATVSPQHRAEPKASA